MLLWRIKTKGGGGHSSGKSGHAKGNLHQKSLHKTLNSVFRQTFKIFVKRLTESLIKHYIFERQKQGEGRGGTLLAVWQEIQCGGCTNYLNWNELGMGNVPRVCDIDCVQKWGGVKVLFGPRSATNLV